MSGNAFKVAVEINYGDIDAVNRKLSKLAVPASTRAMKSGFRQWFKGVRSTAKALAPYGDTRAMETVRGQKRPNPHIRDHIAYTVRGYSKGRVVWGALGVKERRGSYDTPHWYLRWVEFGHEIKRRATQNEAMLLKSRGERRMTMTIGRVLGKRFIERAYQANATRLLPIMEDAIAREVLKEWSNG
jgi:hypothetical protein